ncbi:MAG: response regulator transcription factor [Catenulispora sp.]|nr:response regulator transcription factor [Catenulispora sp.]
MRVVLAEDLFLLRDGMIRLLEAYGFEIAAAVGDGPALVSALVEQRPDVAVVDVRMPPTFTDEGLRSVLEARKVVPGLPVLVLSQYVEQLYATELLADGAGAIGYLLKDRVFDSDSFVDAVRRVAAGGTVMDPEVIAKLLARNARKEPLGELTDREREVLGLMAEGRSNAAIAERLVVTERAIAKHTSNIFMKLGLPESGDDNRRVLAVLAYLKA